MSLSQNYPTAVAVLGPAQTIELLGQARDDADFARIDKAFRSADASSVQHVARMVRRRSRGGPSVSASQPRGQQPATPAQSQPAVMDRDEYRRVSRAARAGDQHAQQRLKQHRQAGGQRYV